LVEAIDQPRLPAEARLLKDLKSLLVQASLDHVELQVEKDIEATRPFLSSIRAGNFAAKFENADLIFYKS
jgi:hypothetical protein